LTAARQYSNSPPELPPNSGQIILNLNDYQSDPLGISSRFCLPDITDWWRQKDETHSNYADLTNVACDIFSIVPHCVGVEASCSLWRDVIGWRQSKSRGEDVRKLVILRLFARANNGLLVGDDPELGLTRADNAMEMKRKPEQKKLH